MMVLRISHTSKRFLSSWCVSNMNLTFLDKWNLASINMNSDVYLRKSSVAKVKLVLYLVLCNKTNGLLFLYWNMFLNQRTFYQPISYNITVFVYPKYISVVSCFRKFGIGYFVWHKQKLSKRVITKTNNVGIPEGLFSSDVMMYGVKMTIQSPFLEKGLMRFKNFLSKVASKSKSLFLHQ